MMFIYELEVRVYEDIPDYDSVQSMVVIAVDASTARELAATESMDEGADVWLKPSKSKIRRLGRATTTIFPAAPRVVCVNGSGS